MPADARTPSNGSDHDMEKYSEAKHLDTVAHDVHEVGTDGHAATDEHGVAYVQLDPKAERALAWKIDLHIIPIISLLYLCCFIDRANIGNAKLAGLEKDLGMDPTSYQYNLLLTAFYAPYVVFEIPCSLVTKIFGPSRVIPIFSFLFGLFAMATGFTHSFGGAFACRFLLGIAESAIFPGMAYYLSRWYRKDELAWRLSLYVVCAPLAGAFGGLLASGILLIPNLGPNLYSWRMIFFLEGLATMLIAIGSWFVLTESIETATWLTQEEKDLASTRIKAENVGSLVVVDKFQTKAFKQGIFNPTTLTVALIFLLDNITVQGMGFFLPIIKTIYPTKTLIQLQLQTVPPYIVGAFATLAFPYLSMKTNKRGMWMMVSAPFIVAGYACFVGTTNPTVRYSATFLIAIGAFSFGALTNAWVAANTTSDTARNAAIATNVMAGNCGGLIATWSYLAKDAPNFYPGNRLNLATGTLMFFLAGGLVFWQKRQNEAKDAGKHDYLLDGLTPEEISALGGKHPGFRYRY